MKNSVKNETKLLVSSQLGVAMDKDRKSPRHWLAASLSVLCLSMGFAGAASAKDVYLKAQYYDKTIALPDGTSDVVPMWGFATCTDSTYGTCTIDESGLHITADKAVDSALTIHVQNTLPAPVSIVIPGQLGGGDPTMVTDAAGRTRMRSMTHEVDAFDGTTMSENTYSWHNLKTGTFLIHSGTQPSLQVPMGLYGSLSVVNGAEAYTGVTFDIDTTMLLSEIDPLQNRRVASSVFPTTNPEKCVPMADYKVNATVGYPCTIDYNPIYLLTNGQTRAVIPPIANTSDNTVLVRFVNAGLRTHTPAFAGQELSIVAEDGNKLPGQAHTQDSALLTAGKTIDATVFAPAGTNVTLSMYDHMSSFTNLAGGTNGGALADVVVGAGTVEPPPNVNVPRANDDVYDVIEDTALTTPYRGQRGVLSNDIGLQGGTASAVTNPAHGTLVFNPDGNFTYTPNPNFSGTDSFTYSVATKPNPSSSVLETYGARVTLNVSFVNDAPIAAADAYSNALGTAINVDAYHGVLGNDSDPDGDNLTAVLVSGSGVTLHPDGSFDYTAGTSGSFTYHAVDSAGAASADTTVTLTVTPPAGINLSVVEFGTSAAIDSYRWIVQEDNTYHLVDAANPQTTPVLDQQALNLHKSTMTVIAQGCSNCSTTVTAADGTVSTVDASVDFSTLALDPNKYYYVSVLPNDAVSFDPAGALQAGHTLGGAQITPEIMNGTKELTVIVNPQEIPTAQIAVEVFQDTAPTNGANDGEPGLGGFTITLEDGGGRYGMSAGIMIQDYFGKPLRNALGDPDPVTNAPGCFGSAMPPAGVIETCPDTEANRTAGIVGHVLIKDLAPGKYGVIALPPASEKTWVQTSTIEGTKIIDAWVKPDEPAYFAEFGLTGPHAFIGFTRPETTCIGPQGSGCQVIGTPGTHTITGRITALHDPKPPLPMLSVAADNADFFSATRFWVGLNSDAGTGPSIATIETNEDGTFTIPNVPAGNYQLVVWDIYLDALISYFAVDVVDPDPANGIVGSPEPLAMNIDPVTGNEIPQSVAAWFTRSEHNVFLDDGCGAGPTDPRYGNGIRDLCDDGVTLEEGLPDQAVNIRWRDGTMNQSFPTDSTGFVPFDEAFPFFSWQLYEVDYLRFKPTGVTVTVDKGGPLAPGEFISPQIQEPALFNPDVDEACTPGTGCASRTETGPVLLEAFQSLPGQTLLFDWGKVPYQPGENGGIAGIVSYATTRAEWDPRLTVMEPWEPGIANVKVRLYSVVETANIDPATGKNIEALSLLKEVQTDSWDAAPPTGCQGETDLTDPYVAQTLGTSDAERSRCIDGFRGWNQARPGVFDGGYAFMTIPNPNDPTGPEMPIPAGKYVVEVVVPPGYEQYKEEDMNVTMGDARTGDTVGMAPVSVTLPTGALVMTLPDLAMVEYAGKAVGVLQPQCVGQMHTVPAELSLFPGEAAPFAGADRPLCNRKLVVLSDQSQAAADFHLFTSTPVAAQFTGLITDDLSMETNPASVMMGEKFGPAYLPFTMRDYKGTVMYSGLGDAFGRYNGLIPSTFSANIPMPSGYSPQMVQACLNGEGPMKNSRYITECVTGQFMPGTNTYLDTPILPQSAFAGGFNPPDCAAATGTPGIAQVDGTGVGPLVAEGGTLTITSPGVVAVPNPAYEGPLAAAPYNAPTELRNYGFGTTAGTVMIGGNTIPAENVVWGESVIQVTIPAGTASGELQVINSSGAKSVNAVTVTVSNETPIRVSQGGSIQNAIDTANPGDLILVAPGTYNERVIMWKPVRLQGAGPGTVIDAQQTGARDLDKWNAKLAEILPNVDLLPGTTTIDDTGAGITVIGKASGTTSFGSNMSRIDGFTITNAFAGGAILVSSNATNLEIANNRITANSGQFGGGIRVGQPNLPAVEALPGQGIVHYNDNVDIHHNEVVLNGGNHLESVGGGISINYGSNGYTVHNNFICGNYTNGDGAGIGHLGVSDGGRILSNKILFNQAYNNSFTTSGGGIVVAGESLAGTLGTGTGNVSIDSNVILGNHAASGHGGGIRLAYVNGTEITGGATPWRIDISNNMIANNVAGWSGAGISLMDAVNTFIVNNQVVSNDTTATQGSLIVGNQVSNWKPSGIVAMPHSLVGAGTLPGTVSLPTLTGNTIWHNRTFHLDSNTPNTAVVLIPELTQASWGDCDANATYWDLGVLGTTLRTLNGVSASATAPAYTVKCNGARTLSALGPIQVYLGTGEGGNFADVRFGPLFDMRTYPTP